MRILLILLSFVPGFIHWKWISSALWSHNSSAAFDMWLLLWGLSIFIPIYAIVVTKPRQDANS